MNILLALDGSPYTKKMLAYLATHDWLDGRHQYTALTVATPLPARARAVAGKEAVAIYYREEADKVLAPVAKFLARHGITAKPQTKVGSPGETIAQVAAGGYDLLVMGAHGHGALAGLVMGSVTNKVLASSKVPVLVVR